MTSETFEVTSELYSESEFQRTDEKAKDNGSELLSLNCRKLIFAEFNCVFSFSDIIAKFLFNLPEDNDEERTHKVNGNSLVVDKDGDLEVVRRGGAKREFILIEHSQSTVLQLVGRQVWRGALLINDYLIHHRQRFKGKNMLELGSGVGLSSILAALYCDQVWCTDLNIGGLLNLIRENVRLNGHLKLIAEVQVHELDFMNRNWDQKLLEQVRRTDLIIAADVVYDDTITEAFITTIGHLFEHSKKDVEMLVALEKRFVFTLAELDSVAPCFEHFLRVFDRTLRSKLRLDFLPIGDFPQYFQYDRVKQLVLMRITRIN